MKKRNILFIVFSILLVSMLTVSGCSKSATNNPASDEKAPTIRMAWGFDQHAGLILTAALKGEAFKDMGIYLKPLVDKEKYDLYQDDKKLATMQMVLTKGSSESAVMLGQKQLDACCNSITGMMAAKDQGTDVKVLCPAHTDGIAMVFPVGTEFTGWDGVKNYIENAKNPVKIGYHSPTSAPRVVIEKVLRLEGYNVTEDPNSINADVLLVDLKGTSNLIPSLSSKQVDAWVGPSVYPETAEVTGQGKIVCELKDFPPADQWTDFACCVFAARQDVLEQYPEVFEAMVQLLSNTAQWCNDNKDESAKIVADMIGIDPMALEKSSLVYTTNPTAKWENAVSIYLDALNSMDKFSGDMKGKTIDDIKAEMFDFTFINKIHNS